MVFSTPVFLYVFLPLTLLIYYLLPIRFRNLFLMLMSLLFYFWGERLYVLIMVLSVLVDYTHGMLVEYYKACGNDRAARRAAASSVILNLGILFFFKYRDFLAGALTAIGVGIMPVRGIHLPIGISFFTFQTMSYTIDVYRGDAKAQHSIINFGTFVTLFPQLIAGPIIKYKELGDQIDERICTVDKFADGVCIFMLGMSKKLLLANNLGQLWDVYKNIGANELTVLGAWLGVLAYTAQIYFDFSGYSDMASGLGKMLGFEFCINFNYPYISKSITEFWRRWHISLSSWFKEYLYIPLGGNRCSKAKQIRNIFLVWAATGLWHGASWNYLLWGLYFFVLLMLEKHVLQDMPARTPAWLRHLYTMFLVVIGWTIFGLEDFTQLKNYLAVMFGFGGTAVINGTALYYLKAYLPVLCIAAVASTPIFKDLYERASEKAVRWIAPVLVLLALAACTAYIVAGTYNPFLYFRF